MSELIPTDGQLRHVLLHARDHWGELDSFDHFGALCIQGCFFLLQVTTSHSWL